MPTSMPSIRYIGGRDNNDYLTSVSGNEPYIQTLSENSPILPALMSGNIVLAESTTPKVMSSSSANTHQYKMMVEGELVPYTVNVNGMTISVNAENMPKHLIGWQAWNNTTNQYEDFTYETLSTQVINQYNEETQLGNEIALYGKWEDISLIRVIFFISGTTYEEEIDCQYISAIGPLSSYIDNLANAYSKLSNNYKSVVDWGNPNYKHAIEYYQTPEYGQGDGCTESINSTNHPEYFAVKKGDIFSFEACMNRGEFIPQYEMVQNMQPRSGKTPQYHYYVTSALRCKLDGWENETPEMFNTPQLNQNNKLCWTSQQNITADNDITISVPLRSKPILTVTTVPDSSGFYAYIGNNTQENQKACMPNDTLTVNTYTTYRLATFEGWYEYGSLLSTNESYSVQIEDNTHLVAKWNVSSVPQTSPNVEVSYFLIGGMDTSVSENVQYCNNGTTWANLQDTNIVNFQHTQTNYDVVLRCPAIVHGTGEHQTSYMFIGFREYFMFLRNPLVDTVLSQGDFSQGGSYTAVGIITPYQGYQLTMSNLANNTSYKVYACYRPISV